MIVRSPLHPTGRQLAAARLFGGASALYVAAVGVQVFLAGLGVFAGPANFETHREFAHVFAVLSLVLLATAWLGRLPAPARRNAGILLALLIVQGSLVIVGHVVSPAIAALHPVNALVIAAFAWSNAKATATWATIPFEHPVRTAPNAAAHAA